MKVIAVVCTVLLVSSRAALGRTILESGERIVGGEDAPEGRYPYIASLRYYSRHFCGGVILNEEWIVSAAHCLQFKSPTSFTAVVGTNNLEEGGTVLKVTKVLWHEKYDTDLLQNDVGLVGVETIRFTDRIKPIPVADYFVPGSLPIGIIGWGTTYHGGQPSPNLKFLNVKSLSVEVCQETQTDYPVLDNQICTFTKVGEGACHGDSGGPVVVVNDDGEEVLAGLVSWGRPCAEGYPDVHTRVYSFIQWINAKCEKCIITG